MRFRKKVYRDYSSKNNCSSIVTHYSHDEWTIEELEHRVVVEGVSGRFLIVQQPNWLRDLPLPFDSFDEAASFINQKQSER